MCAVERGKEGSGKLALPRIPRQIASNANAFIVVSKGRKREQEGALQAPAVARGRKGRVGKWRLPQTLEACCLCQLKADAANWRLFWAATKEYQSAFQGVSRQFAGGECERGKRGKGGQAQLSTICPAKNVQRPKQAEGEGCGGWQAELRALRN